MADPFDRETTNDRQGNQVQIGDIVTAERGDLEQQATIEGISSDGEWLVVLFGKVNARVQVSRTKISKIIKV